MNRPAKYFFLTIIALTLFIAGTWYGSRSAGTRTNANSQKILYWHDPMHPAYKSDKPGIAPDCGMQLEPVYEGEQASEAAEGLGDLKINLERQQAIGVKTEVVRKAGGNATLRMLGRVTVKDDALYRVILGSEGWIRKIYNQPTGTLVKKNELLATFYDPEFLTAEQSYFFALESLRRFELNPKESASQINLTKASVSQAMATLKNLGMGEPQLEQLKKTPELTDEIGLYAPEAGLMISRNATPGQRYERFAELFRIADIRRVWVIADVYEQDALRLQPGTIATVRYKDKIYKAQPASTALPLFDGATRTLKLRLEVDNSDLRLLPDMFVEVEAPVAAPKGVAIPANAVLDSGARKTVFVDKGNGRFEPRLVETGSRFGEQVEVVRGLAEGELIVVSGNFLIDSESRIQRAAAGISGTPVRDPVCGMDVDATKAKLAGKTGTYQGKTYYFCSDTCKKDFEKNPVVHTAVAGM